MASQQAPNLSANKVAGVHYSTWDITDGTTHLVTISNAVATDWADVTTFHQVTIIISNGITGTFTTTIQGSNDGTNWFTVGARADSSAAYVLTAITQVGVGVVARTLSPDDNWKYIRLLPTVINATAGTTVKLYARSG